MEIEKLKIKDLVTIGVFTVIYFVLMFLSGMIGMDRFYTWHILLWQVL